LKGGHSRGKNAVDILWDREGVQYKFSSQRLPGKGNHGTGCHLSAAILANLALGRTLPESCQIAKDYLTELLQSGEGRLAKDF
jgi:hydroxymethylpyrimidine/phosphomethylpyrimidine kinase